MTIRNNFLKEFRSNYNDNYCLHIVIEFQVSMWTNNNFVQFSFAYMFNDFSFV